MATASLLAACSDSAELTTGRGDSPNGNAAEAVQFSTYMGRTGTTRGGSYGALNTARLHEADYGFGVFAYSTGAKNYADYRNQGGPTEAYPTFMYNEWIKGGAEAGKWVYAEEKNTKYWPNDNNGTLGQVSFFAYAPYAYTPEELDKNAELTGQTVTARRDIDQGTEYGIVAFSGNAYNGEAGGKFSDPYVKYIIAKDDDKQVDLLWGTTGTNGNNVAGEVLPGVAATTYDAQAPDYHVNADLTKQKTDGTIHFLFKHALAKIGGAYVGNGDGSDDDGLTRTNGLMVVLDIDKEGQELGGSLQPYVEGADVANTPYNTKVTVNSIQLESGRQLKADADVTSAAFDYDSDTEGLMNTGILNLATGVWTDHTNTNGILTRTQSVVPATGDATTDGAQGGLLHPSIAEQQSFASAAYTRERFEELPVGVTTVPKNVYQQDAAPFVFIPGTKPVIRIAIDYTVRTYDAKLANKYSEVRQRVTKVLCITEPVELNKQYNILMHLGLTSVKLTATVSDWDIAGNGAGGSTDGVSGGTIAVDDATIEHVYLPVNVAE